MNSRSISRVLAGVLVFQLGIGVLLVLGDMSFSSPQLFRFGPDAPRLTEPVRPGDQRRRYAPGDVSPTNRPGGGSGPLPERLTLTRSDEVWRLDGTIAPGDADRIAIEITTSTEPVTRVALQSPGGTVDEALRLGRFLRNRGIDTEVRAGAICYSACPYLLAGGEQRRIDDAASVGVHQHSFGENTFLPAFLAVEGIQRGQGEVMAYLDEMGVDPRVMIHALGTPANEIYILLPPELDRYGLRRQTES